MDEGRIGLGLIGYGYWGPKLLRNLLSLTEAEVVAVADVDPDRLAPLVASGYRGGFTTDHRDLVARPDVDAVLVATPVSTHARVCEDALASGKHVFVEKPLARSVAEGGRLVDLAARQRRTLMVGHTFLYSAPVRWLKKCVDAGTLGEVRYLHSQRLNLGRVQSDVNVLWNVAPHDVAIAVHLLGEVPHEVSARGACYLGTGIEDVVFLTLAYDDGRLAHVHLSWLDPAKVRRTTVVGSRKSVVYDDVSADAPITLYDRAIDVAAGASDGRPRTHRGDVVLPSIELEEPLRAECRHFVECVRERRRPDTNGRHGLDVVRVLEAAERSMAEGGRAIRPPQR